MRHLHRDAGVGVRQARGLAGRALAGLHQVPGEAFGLAEFDGFFGPLPQTNRPAGSGRWADFYAERRVLPMLPARDRFRFPPGFGGRRELWRLHLYRAAIAVGGATALGRSFLPRLAAAVRRYA